MCGACPGVRQSRRRQLLVFPFILNSGRSLCRDGSEVLSLQAGRTQPRPGRHWRTGNRPMSVPLSPGSETLPISGMRRAEEICFRFEDGWKAGQRPRMVFVRSVVEWVGPIPRSGTWPTLPGAREIPLTCAVPAVSLVLRGCGPGRVLPTTATCLVGERHAQASHRHISRLHRHHTA
jgi:hypothetical protein